MAKIGYDDAQYHHADDGRPADGAVIFFWRLIISMVLMQKRRNSSANWSYVFLALTHRYTPLVVYGFDRWCMWRVSTVLNECVAIAQRPSTVLQACVYRTSRPCSVTMTV